MSSNPHPARKPGATRKRAGYKPEDYVPILTRLGSRVQRRSRRRPSFPYRFQSSPGSEAGCNKDSGGEGLDTLWFQSSPGSEAGCNRAASPHLSYSTSRFQSSPGSEAGCNAFKPPSTVTEGRCSNPHPARKPGATAAIAIPVFLNQRVPILTRLGSRVQPKPGTHVRSDLGFQSSPGSEAGCNPIEDGGFTAADVFQSSPGSEAGCNVIWER